jgi:protoporphyrin/coproporphyrin ferrochelatase
VKLAVVLFNLGGPDSLSSVEPFLRNLFSDPAIIPLPSWLRRPLAAWIARRRAPVARDIYRRIGGRSPLLDETRAQAANLELALRQRGTEARVFIAMRAWHPRSDEAARLVAEYAPQITVLLPLYPQFSTATSASSLNDWRQSGRGVGLSADERRVCCYPWDTGFVSAIVDELRNILARCRGDISYRVLFSAHGLPKRMVARGDPYQWQVERTAEAVLRHLSMEGLDWKVCYQSRVGPQRWLEPTTESELRRAGAERRGAVVVPLSFVSEHSETLVELDMDYAKLAGDCGVPHYLRVGTVRTNQMFIDGLAGLVLRAAGSADPVTCGSGRICPSRFVKCGMTEVAA